jgi:hypothetical protein
VCRARLPIYLCTKCLTTKPKTKTKTKTNLSLLPPSLSNAFHAKAQLGFGLLDAMAFQGKKLINDPKGSHFPPLPISLASFFALSSPIVPFRLSFSLFTIFRRVL